MGEEQKDKRVEKEGMFNPDVYTPLGRELVDIVTVFRELGRPKEEIEGALRERVRAPYPANHS